METGLIRFMTVNIGKSMFAISWSPNDVVFFVAGQKLANLGFILKDWQCLCCFMLSCCALSVYVYNFVLQLYVVYFSFV